MKTLKLKMQDLTNPTILTSHEIKNIMGGSGGGGGSTTWCWATCYNRIIEQSLDHTVPNCDGVDMCGANDDSTFMGCQCNTM
jgi:hypothetical protein